jgi:hypothetical protein
MDCGQEDRVVEQKKVGFCFETLSCVCQLGSQTCWTKCWTIECVERTLPRVTTLIESVHTVPWAWRTAQREDEASMREDDHLSTSTARDEIHQMAEKVCACAQKCVCTSAYTCMCSVSHRPTKRCAHVRPGTRSRVTNTHMRCSWQATDWVGDIATAARSSLVGHHKSKATTPNLPHQTLDLMRASVQGKKAKREEGSSVGARGGADLWIGAGHGAHPLQC